MYYVFWSVAAPGRAHTETSKLTTPMCKPKNQPQSHSLKARYKKKKTIYIIKTVPIVKTHDPNTRA